MTRCAMLSRRGVPLYGLTEANAAGPEVQLRAETVRRDRTAWLESALWLSGAGLAWGMSFFPALLTWGRRVAPEQFALAGGVLWLCGGWVAFVLFLLAIAVLARFIIFGRLFTAWLRRRPATVAVEQSNYGEPGASATRL